MNQGPLFETVAGQYERIVDEMKAGTQKSYKPANKRAVKYFTGKRMREIEPYMISLFLETVSSMAHTTVSNQKTVIDAIFQLWIDGPKWHGDRNPAALAKMPRGLKRGKRLPPTKDQVQVVKDHYLDPDALPAVVYLCTGEACAIQLKDIDFKNNIIHTNKVVEHINNKPHITVTKTEAGIRAVPLLSMLREALMPLRNLPLDTLFILSGTNTPLTASQYSRRCKGFRAFLL